MAKTVATERAYPISVKWDTIGDPSLFLWRTWREFDSADYYNILFFQDIPIDDDYKEHSIRVMMQEFRWMSIKNLQLSFKLNEHRYAPTVRWVRAALEAIKRAFGVNDFSKIMGRNVAFVAPLPREIRRVQWKILNYVIRDNNPRRLLNLDPKLEKEMQWEKNWRKRKAQKCGLTHIQMVSEERQDFENFVAQFHVDLINPRD